MDISSKRHKSNGLYELLFKRLLDIVLAFLALILLFPVFLITSILVRIKLGSPIIFTQERPGKIDCKTGKERIFKLYKFRTMTDERNEDGELLSDEERLTTFGRKLRSSSLDELPELLNIIKGDMSLVGPRPLLIRYLSSYTEEERHRHDVRPGLTGLAQIHGRNLVGWDERLKYDVQYVNTISFKQDIWILLQTVAVIFHGKGVESNSYDVEPLLDEERNNKLSV